ncbi:MAG: hypothetical protein ACFB0E_18770 [Leptolyngbyaceae cyanobacterium]
MTGKIAIAFPRILQRSHLTTQLKRFTGEALAENRTEFGQLSERK